MHPGKKRLAISLVLVASLLVPSVALAQGTGANHDWSGLKAVATGSKLLTKLKNGKTVEGKLSSVSDNALSLTVKGKPTDLNRDDILSVYEVNRKSATKATLIGAGVGAGAGAAIGLAGSGDNSFDKIDHAVTAGLTVIGAAAGAGVGYLIGRSGRKRVLVYEAR